MWAWAPRQIDSEAGLRLLAWGATAAAADLTFLLAARRPREQGLVLVVGGSVVAYLLLGTYVVAWYLAWGLPVLVLLWRWRVAWLALAHAALLQLATARPPVQGPDPRSAGVARLQGDLYEVVAPLFAATATVMIIVAMARRLWRTPAADGDGDVGTEPGVAPTHRPVHASGRPGAST